MYEYEHTTDFKKKEVGISLRINEELYEELRKRAHHQRRSQKSIIEEALRFLFTHIEK
jgi:hypothetical protein